MIELYIYILIYVLMFILSIKEIYFGKKYYKSIYFLVVILSILAGIRNELGIDYKEYYYLFLNLREFSQNSFVEPGFKYMIVFLNKLNFNPKLIFITFSLLSLYPLARILIKNTTYPMYSLFLYYNVFYFSYIFNTLRQGIVLTIFLYISTLTKKRKKLTKYKILIYSLLASLIHKSGIFSLIFLKKENKRKKNYIIVRHVS